MVKKLQCIQADKVLFTMRISIDKESSRVNKQSVLRLYLQSEDKTIKETWFSTTKDHTPRYIASEITNDIKMFYPLLIKDLDQDAINHFRYLLEEALNAIDVDYKDIDTSDRTILSGLEPLASVDMQERKIRFTLLLDKTQTIITGEFKTLLGDLMSKNTMEHAKGLIKKLIEYKKTSFINLNQTTFKELIIE